MDIEDDAYSVILSFGTAAAKEINKYYLTASGNINYKKNPTQAFVSDKQECRYVIAV